MGETLSRTFSHSFSPAVLPFILAFGCWAFLFWDALLQLAGRWASEDYSHCYLIPPLAGFLIYQSREKPGQSRNEAVWPGYVCLGFSGVLYLLGRAGSLETLVYLSMWSSLAGLALLLLGSGCLRALTFPFLVLLFAIPAPPFITSLLTSHLRLISSGIAVRMLQFMGMPAYQEGNIIDIGITQFQVVDACSGLRYVLPSILISLVIGYFFNKKLWHRAFLVALAIPLSVLLNSCRIVLGAMAARYISVDINNNDVFHATSGWAIFVLTGALIYLMSRFLQRFAQDAPAAENMSCAEGAASQRGADSPAAARSSLWMRGLSAAGIFLAVYCIQAYLVTAQESPLRKTFQDFPSSIGNWEGKRAFLSAEILGSLWADDYFTGFFQHKATGNTLNLLVPYYARQTTQHTAHAPTSCLLGGGWSLREKTILPRDEETGRRFPVQQMVLEKNGQRLLSNFWFQQRGRIITSEYVNKWYLFWDALSRHRTDGALVRVEMSILPGQSVADAQALLDGYTSALKPILSDYIPD